MNLCGGQNIQSKTINTQVKDTSDSYLPGETWPFPLNGLFFRAAEAFQMGWATSHVLGLCYLQADPGIAH